MLSIAIISNIADDIELLNSKLHTFFINYRIITKVQFFSSIDIILSDPYTFDIYFIDIDNNDISLFNRVNSNNNFFIYYSDNKISAYDAFKYKADFFLCKPIETKSLNDILLTIKQKIKEEVIIIKSKYKDYRMPLYKVNYINIIKRNLCYHLCDGTLIEGQALRTSFKNTINPLQYNPALVFIPPSLLINILNIKTLGKDYIIFENEEIVYFPRKSRDIIARRWNSDSE